MAQPCFKVVGLHVEGLCALKRVDWPADGMGWGDKVPDMVMVGGVNGSGKTTLLELIAAFAQRNGVIAAVYPQPRVWIDFHVADAGALNTTMRVAVGDDDFLNGSARPEWSLKTDYENWASVFFSVDDSYRKIWRDTGNLIAFGTSSLPSILYLPSDRSLEIPPEQFKGAGKMHFPIEFFHRYQRASSWKQSLEALLYNARWEDLNAKEEGHPENAIHFDAYASAFESFFEGSKRLSWRGGELVVEITDGGATHDLTQLSSGEKQMIIVASEILRRWRPGSLILIDEPEFHLHPAWQTKLWQMLTEFRQKRGGQVIVATQSNHLFRIAEPGCKVILGGGSLG